MPSHDIRKQTRIVAGLHDYGTKPYGSIQMYNVFLVLTLIYCETIVRCNSRSVAIFAQTFHGVASINMHVWSKWYRSTLCETSSDSCVE